MEYSTVILVSIYAVTAIVKHYIKKKAIKVENLRLRNLESDSEAIKTRLRAIERTLDKPQVP